MLGRDHALTGGLAFAAVAPLLHVGAPALAAGVVLTAGAGVLPDIDEPGSTIARQGGFLTEGLSWVVHEISGGHRKLTHSVIGIGIFTAATWAAVAFDGSVYTQVALGLFLALLLAAALHALRIGGHHGSVLALAAAAAAVHWHAGLSLVPLCIALGAAAHVAGDELTHSGCPLAYPLSDREFHLLPSPLRFTTGKMAEHAIVTPVLLAALAFLAWHDLGTTALAAHARTAIGAP